MRILLIFLLTISNISANEVVSIEKLTSLNLDTPKCSISNLYKSDKQFAKNAIKINHIFNSVRSISKQLNIDHCLILSMIGQESSFKSNKVSNKGAKGLMQVMPLTKEYILKTLLNKSNSSINKKQYSKILSKLGNRLLTKEENENILLGVYYFEYLMKKFDNNSYHAIMAYNMGSGWVNRNLKNNIKIGVNNNYLSKVLKNMELIVNN